MKTRNFPAKRYARRISALKREQQQVHNYEYAVAQYRPGEHQERMKDNLIYHMGQVETLNHITSGTSLEIERGVRSKKTRPGRRMRE